MVYFTEYSDSTKRCLIILKDGNQSLDSGIVLPVRKGAFENIIDSQVLKENFILLPKWSKEKSVNPNSPLTSWFLESSIHNKIPNENPESTLGCQMISDSKIRWGTVLKVHGEFYYLSHYWEWLELAVARNTAILKRDRLFDAVMASMYTYDRNSDIVRAFCEAWCPSTNTLHTSAGEMSISLWDLWVLGGLPIKGVVEEHKDKTYLAAFLSCWLCVFVFPDKQISFRPEVFKVASLMAEGYTFSLAIPVLANIYSGLHQIHDSTSSLGHSNVCFPIHYVHGWLALYFNTHYKASTSLRGPCMVEFSGEGGAKYYTNLEARMHIHKGNPCRFGRQFGFYQDVPYDLSEKIPKANLANVRYHWMICVRESTLSQVYLPAPTLHPCNHITSHYKAWWLAKHGDYLQEGLQNLIDRPTPSLIKSKTTKKIEHNPDKKICFSKTKEPVDAQFKFAARSGADNMHKDLLKLTTDKRPSTHTEDSHSSNDDRHWKRPKRPDKQSIDDEKPPIEVPDVPMASPEDLSASENSKTPIGATIMSTCPLVTKASPQRVGGTEPITTSEISHFCADNLISDLRQKTAITLWESLRQKIIRTPFERVSSLEPEMRKIFAAIATSGSNNLTFLKEIVDGYFQGVENHNQMRSSILLQSTKDAQLMEAKGFVKTLRVDDNRILEETSIVQRRLARLSAKEAKLEAKLKTVRTESTKLSGIISKNEIELK
ncbi:uncharacterized protein E5676_scaffold726G00240 [Cucumis melo var. makuwa]|uniref:Aminotransferase-like plant mobile domain-containing protein n=1 Tax=Cucumis melo var. makuwa TaxID=1194695 RepID=A0A5A7U4C3_CUCMM|nr:uncharacterized protein E6C27_scaffold560G00370 [Cucumis melo var. makuwa]TYJ95697.1 uncharacterized protein E5676_scaffold726G00240 [Cucumis melo var. makuwa]